MKQIKDVGKLKEAIAARCFQGADGDAPLDPPPLIWYYKMALNPKAAAI